VLETRAKFIMQTMGKLGTQLMVAGARDLNAGSAFLKTEAAKAKVKIISANLREGEQAVFEPSAILTVNGVKVGIVGLSPPGPVPGRPELHGNELAASARPELEKLKGKVDVLVLAASVKFADALQLGQQLKDLPDLIVQSSEFRRTTFAQLTDGGAWLTGSGEKGQMLGKLELKLDGKGPLHDLGEQKREQESLDHLESQLKQLQERKAKVTDPKVMEQIDKMVADTTARRDAQKVRATAALAPDARTLSLDWLVLDKSQADEPQLKAEVLKIEPTYAGSH